VAALEVTFTPAAPYLLARSIGSPDSTRRYRGGLLDLIYPAGDSIAHARVWQRADATLRARIDGASSEPAHDRLRELLAVGLDTRPFLRIAAADPLLAPMLLRLRGLRPLLLSTPVQALIRAVCGQLIRSAEALRIERRIMYMLGTRHDGFALPPDAATLAAAHPALLERAGLSPKRSVVLTRAARRLKLDALATADADGARLRVLREPGLGPWSAGVLLMYGFGRHEQGLTGDLALVRLARALRLDGDRELVERYAPWSGLASVWLTHHPLSRRHAVPAS
jgi:3-methyladenine DNA glycosylase/8-oxoguanine DNA glycosylase